MKLLKKQKIIITVSAFFSLLVFAVGLSLLADLSAVRLASFKLRSETVLGANTYNQTLVMEFSRPLSEMTVGKMAELIVFEPAIEGNFRLNSSTVTFSPKQPLLYDQDYKVIIKSQLTDIYRKELPADLELNFRTKPLQFLAMRPSSNQSASDLLLHTIGKEGITEKLLVEGRQIREYAADSINSRIVYSIQDFDQGPTQLYQMDLNSGVEQRLEVPSRLNISSLQFDRFGNLIFVGSIPDSDIDRLDIDQVPEIVSKPYRFNMETRSLSELNALEKYYGNILDMFITPDGNSAIVHLFNYDMDIVSLLDGESASLGKFNEFGQFNYNGDKLGLLKVDFDRVDFVPEVQIYSDSRITHSTDLTKYSKDPYLTSGAEWIAYSEKTRNIEGSEGQFATKIARVESADSETGTVSITGGLSISAETKSIELPRISDDMSTLAVEVYDLEVLRNIALPIRRYFNAGKPLLADIRVYNLKTENGELSVSEEYVNIANRFNLVWIR